MKNNLVKTSLLFISMICLITFLENTRAEEEAPLFLDLRIKDLLYDSPKKGLFHDGPIGNVRFESVQMSSGDIDIIDLKKENISILDSKLFLKNNPPKEQHILFGKPTGSTGGLGKLGLLVSNKMARFQILLEKNSPIESLRKVSSKDLSLRLNPNCPQVKGPEIQLKMDEMELSVANLDVTCPWEKKLSKNLTDDILLKCLNRGSLRPISFSVPKKNPGYPESLCNNNLKNKPYLVGQGTEPKSVDISVHMSPKPGEKVPKEIKLAAKINSFYLNNNSIVADIKNISLDFLELDPRNPKNIKANMNVKVPFGKIKCEKRPIRNPKFEAKNLVDDCLNGLEVEELGAISIKDQLKGTSFKITPKKINIKEALTFFATDICIADANKAIVLKDIRTKCGKNKKEVFTELPKTITSCLKKGHFVIHSIDSVESKEKPNCDRISSLTKEGSGGSIRSKSDLEKVLSKVSFLNPFSSKKKGKDILKEKKYLKGIGIVITNNNLELSGRLVLSKIETSIALEGKINFNEKENLFSLKLTKAELPFGIESTKLTAWLIKSFLANDKVWVDKDNKIYIKL